jgi:hypothetical protein
MKRIHLSVLLAALFAAGPASADPEPQLISKQSIASFRKPDGTVNNDAFGGGSGFSNFFNGKTTDDVYIGPNGKAAVGSYVLLEFPKDSSMPSGGWYVTSIDIASKSSHAYSLYYSMNGSSWTEVPDAIEVAYTGSYHVYKIAKYVKVVFNEIGGWTPSVCEIQVYGVDPAGLACLHENMTGWTAIQGTANCTEYGVEQRQCQSCGAFFQRRSPTVLPTGHEFETVLVERGTSLAFGSGTNVCRKCGAEIAFPEPFDLTTIGGVARVGVVQFTDLSVSSTGDESYGTRPGYLLDNTWTMKWGAYWYAGSKSTDEFVQYSFGNAIDLTSVEISVPNRNHTLRFYSVDGDLETLVGERAVEYDSSIGTGDNGYQRFTVEFRGVSLRTLRVKSNEESNALTICDVHPWGTVNGAGKSAAVRTRIIID